MIQYSNVTRYLNILLLIFFWMGLQGVLLAGLSAGQAGEVGAVVVRRGAAERAPPWT